jgi:signal transduction histidine kinase
MKASIDRGLRGMATKNTFLLTRQMKDYATIGKHLVWQRQMIFGAALLLAGFYYSVELALTTLVLIGLSETYDYIVFRKILAWKGRDPRVARKFLFQLYLGTMLSAGVIVYYSIGIVVWQGPTPHFMSLFFLFAAALFAAMNNHHLLPVLLIRLAIYGATFIFIPIWDIIVTGADIYSEFWAELFTSIFVLYFIIDCSRIYLNFYRTSVNQMEALRAEHRKTLSAYRAKTEFLSTMSHELRTPLTSIKGSVDLAVSGRLGELPEKTAQVMEIAQRNCSRLITLIDDILDLQKFESGKMSFSLKKLAVAPLLEEAIEVNQPYAARLGVTLRLIPADADLFIRGDHSRLGQVVTNMLSNAAKFSHKGDEVIVKADRHGTGVRISVIDTGVGLVESDREKVFDRFSQLDASDSR